MPSVMMLPMKIASITMPKSVQAIPTYLNAESMSRLRRTLLIFFLIFFLDPKTHIVQKERENKEGDTGGKNGFVFHRSVLYISQAHLYDIGGNGFNTLAGIQRKGWLLSCGNRDHHCFANGARYPENNRYQDAGRRCRHDDLEGGLKLRSAHAVRSFAQ